MNWKMLFATLTLSVALMASPPDAQAQGGRGRTGSRTTSTGTTVSGSAGGVKGANGSAAGAWKGNVNGANGGNASGSGARFRVPGEASGHAGQVQGTGANGGTVDSQGVRLTTEQGGFHKQDTNWNGQNTSGNAQSEGSWQAGQGGQGSSSAEVTNKNTGETHSVDSNTTYDPNAGGSTTVTTGNGTTKTVDYP